MTYYTSHKKLKLNTPCSACIKNDKHCCKRLPLFSNAEIVNLLENNVLENLGFKNLVIQRYINEFEIYTILYKDESFKDYQNAQKNCIFFDKEKGCVLGENMPAYCKEYRKPDSVYHCPYIGISDEDFGKKSNDITFKEDFLGQKKLFAVVFKDFLKKYKQPQGIRKKFKLTKDEIILTFAFHALKCNLKELEEFNILKMDVEKRFGIEPNGELVIYSVVSFKALREDPFLKEYARKINFVVNRIYNSKSPLEVDILIKKTQSIINGIDKIDLTDEMLGENFNGFLLANTIFYKYKTSFKNKSKDFKGLLLNEAMMENAEQLIYQILEKKGIDNYIDTIEKFGDFAEKFIKRVLGAKI